MVKKLKLVFYLILLLTGIGSTQSLSQKELTPCQDPILLKAQTQGLNSLKLIELPEFWFKSWQCHRYAKKKGQSINFRHLMEQKQDENYKEAQNISGIGSTCIIIISLILIYSYFFYFFT